MEQPDGLSTQRKALTLNRDPTRYGTFAEIGAGQEVARWFFRVGGAAGTVAKTMSAYDMTFSEAIYGQSPQFVSRQRLYKMLDHEYGLLVERLGASRGESTQFFVYANTIKAKGFRNPNDHHGWMGVRFQTHPLGEPNEIIIHIWMHDDTNVQQQEAIGVSGVNLIYACLYHHDYPEHIVGSLLDGLGRGRIEVDMISFSGPDLAKIDNQRLNLELVRQGLTSSVVFSPDRSIHQASEILYRRPVILERGRFRPVTNINLEMLKAGRSQFLNSLTKDDDPPIEIMEISLDNLLDQSNFDPLDYLARIDLLNCLDKTVMVSNRSEFYRLAAHLRRNTKKNIAIVLGVPLLREIFDEKYYSDLEGGLLEGFGRLFKRDLSLYCYPILAPSMSEVISASKMRINPKSGHLLAHLLENKYIVELECEAPLRVISPSLEVTRRIAAKDPSWEALVPEIVADRIKEKHYFGWEK